MRHILWADGYPILPTLHNCSAQWLIDRFGGDLNDVDENNLSPLIEKALSDADKPSVKMSANMRMTPSVKLFWITRLHPMAVPLAQLKIMVPKLTLRGTPLDPRITDKIVHCSDRRDS